MHKIHISVVWCTQILKRLNSNVLDYLKKSTFYLLHWSWDLYLLDLKSRVIVVETNIVQVWKFNDQNIKGHCFFFNQLEVLKFLSTDCLNIALNISLKNIIFFFKNLEEIDFQWFDFCLFAIAGSSSHKESIKVSDFNRLYLKHGQESKVHEDTFSRKIFWMGWKVIKFSFFFRLN